MRIAVVGATGMLGHHAAAAVIDAGHELVVVHRASSRLERLAALRFESALADLDDVAAMRAVLVSVDAVIHCAAYYPTLPRPWRDEVAHGLSQMECFYEACAGADLRKIVYLGAAIALCKHPDGEPGSEELIYRGRPRDRNAYLQVKWALDELARDKARAGLPVVIGIPTMSFGEHDHGPTTGQLVVGIANRTLPAYVAGKRNVVYAGDAGRGLVACCDKGRPGERYLLTGRNITMDELVTIVADEAGVAAPRRAPLWLAKGMARAQELAYRLGGPPPKVSATAIAVMSAGQFLDGNKARRELGYEPAVDLREAIARALRWFREQGYVGP
jgi:dihydroflavonol-4-reductase